MPDRLLVPMAGYFLVGVLFTAAIYWLPGGNKARRFLIMYPVMMLAFLGVAKEAVGEIPPFLIVLIVVVSAFNLGVQRFCAKCGAIDSRRGIFSTSTACKKCGGEEYVSLWKALSGPKPGGAP